MTAYYVCKIFGSSYVTIMLTSTIFAILHTYFKEIIVTDGGSSA